MITAVIIDDEKKSREVLKRLIKETNTEVLILAEADSVEEGFKVLNKELPQLIFLDIEMLDGTGFNLLEKFKEIDFEIIFTTAYDKYAIKAFKFSAIDYLLKPIDIEDLEKAILRASNSIDLNMYTNSRVEVLLNSIKEEKINKKIAIKSANKIDFVIIDEIICCNAEQSYTEIILKNDRKIIGTKPLKHFESILSEGCLGFYRVSKSCLLNLNFVISYNKDNDTIELKNGLLIEISRRRKKEFLEAIELM
jgi:two-component system LytT family response regulator